MGKKSKYRQKSIFTNLYKMNDKCVLFSYCHKLHYCHNMDVMINGLITLMLARYLSMHITLTRVTCTF